MKIASVTLEALDGTPVGELTWDSDEKAFLFSGQGEAMLSSNDLQTIKELILKLDEIQAIVKSLST